MSVSTIGSESTSSVSTDKQSRRTSSTESEFLRFMKMSPIDRMRAGILKSMKMSESDLAALPPAERQKIEDLIKQKIQEALSGGSSGGGKKTGAASGSVTTTAAGAMSSGTLGHLIAMQAGSSATSPRAAA